MTGLYARWMDRWERKLATRDTNRISRPFDWGADWLSRIGFPPFPADANGNSAAAVGDFVTAALAGTATLVGNSATDPRVARPKL